MAERGRYNEWIQIEGLLDGELLEGASSKDRGAQSGMLIAEIVVIGNDKKSGLTAGVGGRD